MQNLFENVHTVREEEATLTRRLPCALFLVLALWNSPPTAHNNDAILHLPKQPLCSALHSKMSGLVSSNNAEKKLLL